MLLGLPVLTADYDFWIAIGDTAAINAAAAEVALTPSVPPEAAKARGRYSLENDEPVDVIVAREVPTVDGALVRFDDVWARRRALTLPPDVEIQVPALDGLILTKRFANGPKDLEDIRPLTVLKEASGS